MHHDGCNYVSCGDCKLVTIVWDWELTVMLRVVLDFGRSRARLLSHRW
jgi:predicted rRNA methylase YqxC with S4 and FtsJ domains